MQGGLRGLTGIDARQAIQHAAAMRLQRRRNRQTVVLCQLAGLRLAFHQLMGGIGSAHTQGGQRCANVKAVHRLLAHHQQIGQLDDTNQGMRHLAACQRFGVIAHGIGEPAVLVEIFQESCGKSGKISRTGSILMQIKRKVMVQAGAPGVLGVDQARMPGKVLGQIRDGGGHQPTLGIGREKDAIGNRGQQQHRAQQILLAGVVERAPCGHQTQAQAENRIDAKTGGQGRLAAASRKQFQRFRHHAGGAKTLR